MDNTHMQSILLEYAIKGDELADVVQALERGADPCGKTRAGVPMLAYAIFSFRMGGEQIIQRLLTAGADPNVSYDGRTMLMTAAMRGRPTIVHMLIEAGADKNAVDAEGWSAMMWGSCCPQYDMGGLCAITLARQGAEVNIKSATGSTALMLFASKGQTDTARILLECGADPCLRNENGRRASEYARVAPRALVQHQECEALLLEAEARSDAAVDLDVMTPVASASRPRRF